MPVSKKGKKYCRQLDDQAKIYSLSRNYKDTSIFRFSVVLKDKINSMLLQKAVELAIKKYKAYKVKMRAGFFWYYLEENEKKPVVIEEKDYPFKKLNTKDNNEYLFKVTYKGTKISIEVFHPLTDGNSGSMFFKEIIYRYLELCYPKELKQNVIDKSDIITNSENAYLDNYQKKINKAYNPPKGYMLKGKALSTGIVGINHFSIKLSEIKALAKEKNSTLSALLVTMLIYSIYKGNYKLSKNKKPINVCVPVDLRNYFETKTVSNFVSYIVVSLKLTKNKNYSFEEILNKVTKEFEIKLQHSKIVDTMTSNGKLINNLFVKMVPLALKRIMVVLGTLGFKTKFSTTFSNIGVFKISDEYKAYIKDYYFILAPDWAEKLRCGIVSFNENLVMTFGTNILESNIEKEFKLLLDNFKIKCTIEDNGINTIKK